jgi:phosphatidylethanolamine/phosphatidyl-N-methylethanolamine N-methyltransferase
VGRNLTGQLEYKYKLISRLFKGDKRRACIANGIVIFLLGVIRDFIFYKAVDECHESYSLPSELKLIGIGFSLIGMILVASSLYKLGFIGTYLGDYFGILMDAKVTGFPFNIFEHPMYEGATFCFLGSAFYYRKISGVILTCWVIIVYAFFAKLFEEPFTNYIYSNKNLETRNTKIE